jgi:tetratricopeptide (TPR) repeat protein
MDQPLRLRGEGDAKRQVRGAVTHAGKLMKCGAQNAFLSAIISLMKSICAILLTLILAPAWNARPMAAAEGDWIEVESPHFVVVNDATESQARSVAMQFERVRAVFKKAFPRMRIYPDLPIIILAAKDRSSFEQLEPAAWLGQGQLNRVGMLLRSPDKNYILLRLDAPGQNPYRVIYHEYAHLILEDNFKSIPLWLNEGLAEFYGHSTLDGKTIRLGLPSEKNLKLLQTVRLLPLKTLFTINESSPYYNEANKGTIFYAQSWALTDFLMFQNLHSGRGPIDRYLALIAQGSDPVNAAAQAFGDLDQLQDDLEHFVHGLQFHYYRLKVSLSVDERDLHASPLLPAESDALRGDFLARVSRIHEAGSLLQSALKQVPQMASANESMGLLELHEGHPEKAQAWFAKAASLSPQSYLARFYLALALMKNFPRAAQFQKITNDLNDMIQFNPTFAPAYAALATLYANQLRDSPKAQMLAAKASQLDPHNVHYLFLESEILLKMGNTGEALQVAERAVNEAQSPQDKSLAYVFLGSVQEKAHGLRK